MIPAPQDCEPVEPPPQASGQFQTLTFRAMGTSCEVTFVPPSPERGADFETAVVTWVEGFEAEFSRFRPDSLISRIGQAAGKERVPLSDEATSLFSLCDWFHWVTKGIFDPTCLPLLRLWDYHRPHARLPGADDRAQAKTKCGWERVDRNPEGVFLPEAGMELDMGGIGKEYAVDRVMEMSEAYGIQDCLVNFGQDLRVKGISPIGPAWRIGLENPLDPGNCWGGLQVTNRAVASSGDYHRRVVVDGKRYGHILDPRTGLPVKNECRSVSVIAPTCTQAGIFSSTVFILGLEAGMEFLETADQIEGCICTETHVHQTRRFHESLLP